MNLYRSSHRRWAVSLTLMTIAVGILLVWQSIPFSFAQDGGTPEPAELGTPEPANTPEPAELGTPEPADGSGGDANLPFNPQSEDILERGAYLVRVEAHCVACHGAEGYADDPLNIPLSGGRAFDVLNVGLVYAPNLTTLQNWTDQDIENAIRYGVRPDGTTLLPPMNYALHEPTADADMTAIIAYLRSLAPVEFTVPQAELLEGVTRETVRTIPTFDINTVYDYPENMDTDLLVRGTYMAQHTAQCLACHGAVDENGNVDITAPPLAQVYEFYPMLLQDNLSFYDDGVLREIFKDTELIEMPTFSYQYLSERDVQAIIAWLRAQPFLADLEQ